MVRWHYHPFGLQMPGRTVSDTVGYRYGFQEQEKDGGWLNGAISYKFRIHDPTIGRFLSIWYSWQPSSPLVV